jgi:hypothetical protein
MLKSDSSSGRRLCGKGHPHNQQSQPRLLQLWWLEVVSDPAAMHGMVPSNRDQSAVCCDIRIVALLPLDVPGVKVLRIQILQQLVMGDG